jgi:excisionase family DNA binding protein
MQSPFAGRDRRLDVVRPVTVAEAAVLLGISSLAVYRLIHTNELPVTRHEGTIRIHQHDLATYLGAHRYDAGRNVNASPTAHRRPLGTERPALRLVPDEA